jgi:hypothetical protein
MTTLNVRVTVDANGNTSIDFDREKLLAMPLETVMREVSEEAKRAKEAAQQPRVERTAPQVR